MRLYYLGVVRFNVLLGLIRGDLEFRIGGIVLDGMSRESRKWG